MEATNKKKDRAVQQILDVLETRYKPQHPKAHIESYRYNPTSIRVRIIDPDFEKKDWIEREEMVWPVLESLPKKIQRDIMILLLITPKERKMSFGSMEFDAPTPCPEDA